MPEFPVSVVPPVIPYEDGDAPLHTDERPFCADADCPCHWDEKLVSEQYVGPWLDGLLTNDEAVRLYYSQQL